MGYIGPNFNPSPQQPNPLGNTPATPKNKGAEETAAQEKTGASTQTPKESAVKKGSDVLLAPFLAQQAGFSAQQLGTLLRNLLQMPKEIVQLLALLATVEGPLTPNALKRLLSENPRIPLENLQAFLQENSQFQGKLLKLLQSSQMNLTGNSKNMGDLINHASQLLAKASASPTEALQTTIALYLPWYPLDPPQNFHMHFEAVEGGGENSNEDAYQLVMFIETISMGLFKVVIGLVQQTQLHILVEHDASARIALPGVEAEMTQALMNDSLPPPVFSYQQRASSAATSGQTGTSTEGLGGASLEGTSISTGPKQSIGIHPMGGVSVIVINAAYEMARIVFGIDNRQSLNLKRAQEI